MKAPAVWGVVLAAVLAVGGCASAEPVTGLDAAPPDPPDPAAAVSALTTAMTEVYTHFLAPGTPTTIVSDGATVDVAVAELDEALGLGDGARDFVAATAFEVSRQAAAEEIPVTAVEIVPEVPSIVGSQDGRPVAAVALLQRLTRESGPITEATATYALLLDGDRLDGVAAWDLGLDSGVGLDSPTGAGQRFVDLVRAGDTDAAVYFSAGVNGGTELGVLASALTQTQAQPRLVELPQFRSGGLRVVYLVDEGSRVLGRFEVTLGDRTTVVYSPTS